MPKNEPRPPEPEATPSESTEDDVEGHTMLPLDTGSARALAGAREQEIRRHLRRHDLEAESRRPHKR